MTPSFQVRAQAEPDGVPSEVVEQRSEVGAMQLVSAEEFVRLRASDDPHEYAAADRATAGLHVWLEVLQRYPDYRRWVAHNRTVPLAILTVLAHDADPRVRAAVASRLILTPGLFELLGADAEDAVRLRVVHNAAAPRSVLERLSRDGYDLVRARARVRLGGVTKTPAWAADTRS